MAASSEASSSPSSGAPAPPAPVIPNVTPGKYYTVPVGMKPLRNKRKVAIVFGYSGEHYCGLQWNRLHDYPTVEEALLKALCETGMVSWENFCNPKVQPLLNFERASRTDKGVHALCNVVSVRLALPYSPGYVQRCQQQQQQEGGLSDESPAIEKKDSTAEEPEGEDDERYSCAEAVKLLRLALPSDIWVYNICQVTRSFNAYLCCGGRTYQYVIPTFAFMPLASYLHCFPGSIAQSHPSLYDIGFEWSLKPPGPRRAASSKPQEEGGGRDRPRGHFPKSKKRRTEMKEAAAAAQQEQQQQQQESVEEEEQEKKEEDTGSSGGDSTMDALLQQHAFLTENLEARHAFLTSHYATHFQDHLFRRMILYRSVSEETMAEASRYRISPEQLQLVRELFAQYEGTNSFHNFTPGGRSGDASCWRFIQKVTVSEPTLWDRDSSAEIEEAVLSWRKEAAYSPDEDVEEALRHRTTTTTTTDGQQEPEDQESLRAALRHHMSVAYPAGLEVVTIELQGQSFMLNQIRKMIGAVVGVCLSGKPSHFLRSHLLAKGHRMPIPMVPANSLLLAGMNFDGYGKRLARIQKDGNNGSGKPQLAMDEIMDMALREKQSRCINGTILRNEMMNDLFGKWLRSARHALRLAWGEEIPS